MRRCRRCSGFVPVSSACPNCAAGGVSVDLPSWLKEVATVAGTAALGVSLCACYGAPVYEPSEGPGAKMGGDANMRLAHEPVEDAYTVDGRRLHHHDAEGEVVLGTSTAVDPDEPETSPCDCDAADGL